MSALGQLQSFPNRHGLLMLAVLGVMLLGSANYSNNLGYGLTFLLMGTWCAALLHGYRNLSGMQVVGSRVEPVFAGDIAHVEIFLRNDSAQTAYGLRVQIDDRGRGRRSEVATSQEFSIAPGATHCVRIDVRTEHRGILQLSRIKLLSTFPLGTSTARRHLPLQIDVVVYPHPAGALPLPVAEDARIFAQGTTQSGTDDFAGLRDYRPGDSLRHIAWKIHARDRGLQLKQFAGGGSEVAHLSLFGLRRLEDVELRFAQLSKWIMEAESLGVPYSLALEDGTIVPGVGALHRDRCLHALALGRRV